MCQLSLRFITSIMLIDHDGQNPRYNDGSIPDYNSDKLDRLLDFGFGSAQTTLFKLGIRGII